MPYGPSRCSITAEAPWRFDRLKLGEIEFDNRPQGLRERTILLIVRQRVQPCGIFRLQLHVGGDGVVPALDMAAAVDRTANANKRRIGHSRGAIACLTFGAGHGCFTDRLRRHGSTPWHSVMGVRCHEAALNRWTERLRRAVLGPARK